MDLIGRARPRGRWLALAVVVLGAIGSTSATASGAEPAASIVRERAGAITQTDAVLSAAIKAGSSETTYRAWVEDPCPGLAECIRDVLVGEGRIRAGRSKQVHLDLAAARERVFIEPGTGYRYWFAASDAAGTVDGASATFTTLPAGSAPAVLDERANHIRSNDALLSAEVSTGALSTEWEIWLEEPCGGGECIGVVRVAHGTEVPSSQTRTVQIELANGEGDPFIRPGTTYSFWTVLKNSMGTVTGPQVSFVTAP